MFWRKSASQRITELEERLASLKRQVEARDLDWVDMRSRCRRLLDRTEKAADRLKPEEPVVDSPDIAASRNGEDAASQGRVLSAHQREVQQQILKRRAGL